MGELPHQWVETSVTSAKRCGLEKQLSMSAQRLLVRPLSMEVTFDTMRAPLSNPPAGPEGSSKVCFPSCALVPLGLALLVCPALYVIPSTAVLGAVLLSGYFGGAIATHIRLGVVAWCCLYLRDARVRFHIDR